MPKCYTNVQFLSYGQSQQNSQKDHKSYFLEKIARKVVRWEVLSMQMHGLKSLELNFCLYISSKFIVCQAFKFWNYCPNFQCKVKPKGASFIGTKAPKVDQKARLISIKPTPKSLQSIKIVTSFFSLCYLLDTHKISWGKNGGLYEIHNTHLQHVGLKVGIMIFIKLVALLQSLRCPHYTLTKTC